MSTPFWIVLSPGAPVAAQFSSARGAGTPIVINSATGLAYFMDATGAIRALGGSAIGITDHGALTGLSDDDHPQYLNSTRGDLLYVPLAHIGSGGTAHADATTSVSGFLSALDKTALDSLNDNSPRYIELVSDFTSSNSTPAESLLAFTPLSAKTYIVEGFLSLETTDPLIGPVITLNLPSNITRGIISLKASTSDSTEIGYHGSALDPAALAVSPMPANTPLPAFLRVSFTTDVASSGDFSISLSQEP